MKNLQINDINDDYIIMAIASFGYQSVFVYDHRLGKKLNYHVSCDFIDRCTKICQSGRLEWTSSEGHIRLSNLEWGRRLVNHSAEEIALLLSGL